MIISDSNETDWTLNTDNGDSLTTEDHDFTLMVTEWPLVVQTTQRSLNEYSVVPETY